MVGVAEKHNASHTGTKQPPRGVYNGMCETQIRGVAGEGGGVLSYWDSAGMCHGKAPIFGIGSS